MGFGQYRKTTVSLPISTVEIGLLNRSSLAEDFSTVDLSLPWIYLYRSLYRSSTAERISTACFIATADPLLCHYYSSYSYTVHLYY